MDEPGVLSAGKHEVYQAELPNPPESLDLAGAEHLDDQGLHPPELHHPVDAVLDQLDPAQGHASSQQTQKFVNPLLLSSLQFKGLPEGAKSLGELLFAGSRHGRNGLTGQVAEQLLQFRLSPKSGPGGRTEEPGQPAVTKTDEVLR